MKICRLACMVSNIKLLHLFSFDCVCGSSAMISYIGKIIFIHKWYRCSLFLLALARRSFYIDMFYSAETWMCSALLNFLQSFHNLKWWDNLRRKATCRRHSIMPKTGSGEIWPMDRAKEVISSTRHEFISYSYGGFVRRRHSAFSSKIIFGIVII